MKKLKTFILGFIKNKLLFHAAQNAFYFVLSLFPFLYLLTRVFTFIPIPSKNILKSLELFFPKQALEIIYANLNTISNDPPSTQSLPYIFIALWSSSMLIYSLKSIFAIFYKHKSHRSGIVKRIFAIILTTIVLIGILCTFITVFFINLGINIVIKHFAIQHSTTLLSIISLALIIFDIILLYVILPPIRIKISEALPGAITTVISLTVFSYGFSYYISHIANYSKLYGKIGSIITLMIWFYICSIIILSGGLINAIFIKEKGTP